MYESNGEHLPFHCVGRLNNYDILLHVVTSSVNSENYPSDIY